MSKYSIHQIGDTYTVRVASIESDPDYDYFNVTQSGEELQCDGDGPKCEKGSCSHIRAVTRFKKAA